MKRRLKRLAYEEAAAMLEADCDRADLPDALTEREEDEVREFIRNEIVGLLRRKSAPPPDAGHNEGEG